MRVSSIGWFFDTMERTREVARWSAEAYYDIPEELIFKCGYYTTKDMFSVFRRFDKLRIGRVDKYNLLRFKKAQAYLDDGLLGSRYRKLARLPVELFQQLIKTRQGGNLWQPLNIFN